MTKHNPYAPPRWATLQASVLRSMPLAAGYLTIGALHLATFVAGYVYGLVSHARRSASMTAAIESSTTKARDGGQGARAEPPAWPPARSS